MTSKVDLHVHTTASDGALTPAQVVELAIRRGIEVVAVTDHDTVAGVAPALEQAAGLPIKVVPGVEISAEHQGVQVHILGYFVDHTSETLVAWLDRFRQARRLRAQQTLDRLQALGIPLAWDSLSQAAEQGVVGRPHIARALVKAGHVATIEEAFGRYLNPGQPAYMPRLKASPTEAIRAISKAGGLPVLAHPWCIAFMIESLATQGLVGLETHYRGYDSCQTRRLARLARERSLICTGGTDFHGLAGDALSLGDIAVPPGCVAELEARRAQRAAG